MRTLVFDLDGTLADTSADLIAAANHCFCALGHGDLLDSRADALTAFHGGRAMLRLGFSRLDVPWSEDDVDAQYPRLLQAYADDIDRHTRLYPGAERAVETLHTLGIATAICTNKPEALAEDLLRRLGVRALFASLVGADTMTTRKPDPAPYLAAVARAGGTAARSALLGDTETDARTARVCGVPLALVTFGPEGRGVERFAPDALLDHFDALPDLAQRLLPEA
ncbi:haloacid dehalogenase [Defluviimonas sp. 20V17]|uniref:phosphoglycolate phosphatase n=1 Tax=Allgaiera indica TaxID=765699 RepID=A0AAN4ZZV6_9RHOB|nr:HAD hydrolase-like protein [Allgaiera indica]KDB02317.1 haloacid dehalogenase [Defluviimonas sp. 20V17]GHE02752.1 phosphoglycolate phosphatase [Allgaiera indica]SDX18246.1 phosphoglycolate phosphatase [Allgaiera indica]